MGPQSFFQDYSDPNCKVILTVTINPLWTLNHRLATRTWSGAILNRLRKGCTVCHISHQLKKSLRWLNKLLANSYCVKVSFIWSDSRILEQTCLGFSDHTSLRVRVVSLIILLQNVFKDKLIRLRDGCSSLPPFMVGDVFGLLLFFFYREETQGAMRPDMPLHHVDEWIYK